MKHTLQGTVLLLSLLAASVQAASPTTRFEDPARVKPAVQGIRRLFADYSLWGQGVWNGKDGEVLRLKNVHASVSGKPQADRVTVAVGYQWGNSDSWSSYYLTLVDRRAPVLQIVTDIEQVPFEPGSRVREGVVGRAKLTVEDSEVRITADEDGKSVTYVLSRTESGIRWTEEHPEGSVTIDISMGRAAK